VVSLTSALTSEHADDVFELNTCCPPRASVLLDDHRRSQPREPYPDLPRRRASAVRRGTMKDPRELIAAATGVIAGIPAEVAA
jgi:hypothetical protein